MQWPTSAAQKYVGTAIGGTSFQKKAPSRRHEAIDSGPSVSGIFYLAWEAKILPATSLP